MKKMTISILIIVLIILLANYTGLKTVLGGLPVYKYATESNEFVDTEILWKGLNFENTLSNFKKFKVENPNTNDAVLYRTFKIEPLKFWNWHDYLTHERYKLPYKEIIK